jgi:hypothetical protein
MTASADGTPGLSRRTLLRRPWGGDNFLARR